MRFRISRPVGVNRKPPGHVLPLLVKCSSTAKRTCLDSSWIVPSNFQRQPVQRMRLVLNWFHVLRHPEVKPLMLSLFRQERRMVVCGHELTCDVRFHFFDATDFYCKPQVLLLGKFRVPLVNDGHELLTGRVDDSVLWLVIACPGLAHAENPVVASNERQLVKDSNRRVASASTFVKGCAVDFHEIPDLYVSINASHRTAGGAVSNAIRMFDSSESGFFFQSVLARIPW